MNNLVLMLHCVEKKYQLLNQLAIPLRIAGQTDRNYARINIRPSNIKFIPLQRVCGHYTPILFMFHPNSVK